MVIYWIIEALNISHAGRVLDPYRSMQRSVEYRAQYTAILVDLDYLIVCYCFVLV